MAILELNEPLTFWTGVTPICIAENFPKDNKPYRFAQIAGFGKLSMYVFTLIFPLITFFFLKKYRFIQLSSFKFKLNPPNLRHVHFEWEITHGSDEALCNLELPYSCKLQESQT